jgi:hypothetical protein
MKEMVLNYLIERSDQAYARYAWICPSCNREWCSTQIAVADDVSAEARKKLATAEAEANFDICLLCGSLVCRSCMAAVGEMKMCKNCADRMR